MSQVYLSELAEGDLADIWVDMATYDIATADEFLEQLRGLAQKLADRPQMGRIRELFGTSVRSFSFRHYVLIYRPREDGIGLARVVHGRRDLGNVEVPE